MKDKIKIIIGWIITIIVIYLIVSFISGLLFGLGEERSYDEYYELEYDLPI